MQTGEPENLLGGDAVDVPPETAIELAEGRKLVRVAGEEGQDARLDRAEIPDDETMPRRRDDHAAAQVPDHSQYVAVLFLECGVVLSLHDLDRGSDRRIGLQQLGPFQILRLKTSTGPSPRGGAVRI